MANLWMRLGGIYGASFTTQYGETDKHGTWRAALSGFTGENLAHGLRACVEEGGDFPPSAAKFRQLCFRPAGPQHAPVSRALPSPVSSLETARHWHKFAVYAGVSPRRTLSPLEESEYAEEFGSDPVKAWSTADVAAYCHKASAAVSSGDGLPDFARDEEPS
jgi:hypothetical protein